MRSMLRQGGMTLIEILIVVAIVAILAAVAVPSYREHIIKTKRAVGAAELLEALSVQEQYFLNNKQYATDLTDLGYGANPYYITNEGDQTIVAADSIYRIGLAAGASATAFTLQAVPQNGQAADADCATMSITNQGIKAASGTNTAAFCW